MALLLPLGTLGDGCTEYVLYAASELNDLLVGAAACAASGRCDDDAGCWRFLPPPAAPEALRRCHTYSTLSDDRPSFSIFACSTPLRAVVLRIKNQGVDKHVATTRSAKLERTGIQRRLSSFTSPPSPPLASIWCTEMDARVVASNVSCGSLTPHCHQRQQRSRSRLAPRASAVRDDAAGNDAAGFGSAPAPALSRRSVLGCLGAVTAVVGLSGGVQAASPGRASAYIVDEENALRVFRMASPSVVGIVDSKRERNGDETPEGVGSGVVWTCVGGSVELGWWVRCHGAWRYLT